MALDNTHAAEKRCDMQQLALLTNEQNLWHSLHTGGKGVFSSGFKLNL